VGSKEEPTEHAVGRRRSILVEVHAVASYRARWVLPVSRPPIENGCVHVEHGRITRIGRHEAHHGATDLGDVAVLPGFVNAHTHLELTGCTGRVPFRGSFTRWIADLAAVVQSDYQQGEEARREAIREGFRQSLAAGVTAVADIGHGAVAVEEWRRAKVHTVGFLEVLGMGPRRLTPHERCFEDAVKLVEGDARAEETARAEAHGSLESSANSSSLDPSLLSPPLTGSVLRRFGLSPHAPYSTDAALYWQVVAYAAQAGVPVCTHLAETREEIAFLSTGTGPFRELLERLGLWDGSFAPPGCSPVRYMAQLGLLALKPLLAHVNYASDDDLDLLAGHGASVVFCPRSHAFFGHEPYRYREMLARRINVCLGTDSLASNASLSILDEMRYLAAGGGLLHSQLLAMGTLAGARALGLSDEIGSLEPGKLANFAVVPLDYPATCDPTADVLLGQAPPAAF